MGLLKKIWIFLAVLIIILAIFSSIFRSLTPWVKQYKHQIETHLTQSLGQPVTIQHMETGWYWFQPVLKLHEVKINDEKKSINIGKFFIGINLFKSIWKWRIQPGLVYLEDLHLVLRQTGSQWQVDGITMNSIKKGMTAQEIQQVLAWLTQQDRLILKKVSLSLYMDNDQLIPLSGINVSIVNHGGHYKIKGEARLAQRNPTLFQILGNLHFDLNQIQKTKGAFYAEAKNLMVTQWQPIIPQMKKHLEGGRGDLALWLDLDKGKLSAVQAKGQLKNLLFVIDEQHKSQKIQNLGMNLSWLPNSQGWELQSDHINLELGGKIWPENQLALKYLQAEHSYQLSVKSLILESLLAQNIAWPDSVEHLRPFKPQGTLENTKIYFKENKAYYFLTRFSQLGWQAKKNIPQVQNISGVLNWQPEEGRLELDGEQVVIKAKAYPKQNFTLINGAIDWKELSHGLRVSIERFVLSQPDLTITTEGALDEVSAHSAENVRISLEFSGSNLQQYFSFLPKTLMKKKLYNWLVHDLKKIAQASGKLVVNGPIHEFPFDKGQGVFTINSHISGGELQVNSEWPLIKDIEAYLRLKNRDLDIDIVNADIQGVPLKQMNLGIADIGHDKESLLLHGLVQGKAEKMKAYILASPLKDKLTILKMLSLKGLALLNLSLEIPLYPENDTNLVKGELSFKNNNMDVNHLFKIPLREVTGRVNFNEGGITQAVLQAEAFGATQEISIQPPSAEKNSYTSILVKGDWQVDYLKNQFNLPLLSILKGTFPVKTLIKLSNETQDLSQVDFQSSLEGLKIALPQPLGKKTKTLAPTQLILDFNEASSFSLKANYNNKLSMDLLLKSNQDQTELKSGEIRLGSGPALNQNKSDLALVGSLDGFDLEEWQQVFNEYNEEDSNNSMLDKITKFDISLAEFTFLHQKFKNIVLKAKMLAKKRWALNIEQRNLRADLSYDKSSNNLSGYIKRLHLDHWSKQEEGDPAFSPKQIPNLNLNINQLSIGEIELGAITIKSHSTQEKWFLDYCLIEAPSYQFNVEGNWIKNDKKNETSLAVKLYLKSLAKSLRQWQIVPAVDADKGIIEFQGGWKGAINDFSLAALSGSMTMQLNHGRITHFSPETEEKLGLGKLLSILSLQTIPRRLQLDFSDLSQGYSFDVFKGNFSIKKGIMNTKDSYIDGPVAYASMKGDLDLVKKIYNMNLSISPHITASLPLVATIAGGPLAGLAVWVANNIINQSMQKISAYTYKISGPWKDPVIQQLTIKRAN